MGTAFTMPLAGIFEVKKNLNNGMGDAAYSTILGTVTSAIIFLSIVIAGLLNRKKPQTHKRLMLLATIMLLWVAWFRFRHYFPSVPRPDIWFGVVLSNSLIVISWIWDKYANGRIHPVLLWVGIFIIAEATFEVMVFDSAAWKSLAKGVFEVLATNPGHF